MAKSQAASRYLKRIAVATSLYVVAVFVTIHIVHRTRVALPEAIGLAIIPSLPIVGIIAIVGIYLKEEKDDFLRELFIQSLLWGTGVTLGLTTFWSFLHIFGHVPAVDGFHVFVMFWIFVGLSNYPLRRYYGGSGE